MTDSGPDHATPPELRGLPRSSYARSHALPEVCEWCYDDIDPQLGDCIHGCTAWDRYWRSLTPAQQDAELAMMDDYAEQHEGDV